MMQVDRKTWGDLGLLSLLLHFCAGGILKADFSRSRASNEENLCS